MKAQGYALIEYAIAIPVILTILLGSTDIIRVYQARAALVSAVDTSLRCLYPAKAKCRQSISQQAKWYEYYQEQRISQALIPKYKYSALVSSLSGPVYTYANPKVTTLKNVNFSIPNYQVVQTQDLVERKARIDYWLRTSDYPYIDTSSAITNPSFYMYGSRAIAYPAQVINSLTNISGTTTGKIYLGKTSLNLPILTQLACFDSQQINKSGVLHTANYTKPCRVNINELVLQITGRVPLRNSAKGKVTIEIEQNSNRRSLGGRVFTQTPGAIGNFVARGAPVNYISDTGGYSEFTLYSPISVSRGAQISLHFWLEKSSGAASDSVAWQGLDLKVFAPNFERYTTELKCDLTRCDSNVKLRSYGIPDEAVTAVIDYPYIEKKIIGCYAKNYSTANFPCTNCKYEWTSTGSCPVESGTQNCKNNFGVSGDPNKESRAEARLICPVLNQDYIPDSEVWQEQENVLDSTYEIKQSDCINKANPVLSYKKYTWNQIIKSGTYLVNLLKQKPVDFLKSNPKYNCSDFVVSNKLFQESDLRITPIEDLFCNWKAIIAAVLKQIGVDEFSYMENFRDRIGTEMTSEIPSCENVQTLSSNKLIKIPGGPYPENNLPPECLENKCTAVPVKNFSSTTTEINYNAAKQMGIEAFRVAVPNIKQNCIGSNCLNINSSLANDVYKVQASYQIPLWLIPGKSLSLSFQMSRKDELKIN